MPARGGGRRMRAWIISGISRRARRSGPPSSRSWRSRRARRKPVFLHQRDAHEDFTAILAEHRRGAGRRGGALLHRRRPRELEAYLELDLSIGITGWVCDERRGRDLRAAVPRIPRSAPLLETDAPYLLPRDLVPRAESRRNEPAYLPHIARTVAQLRGESLECVAAATTRNAARFFGLRSEPGSPCRS